MSTVNTNTGSTATINDDARAKLVQEAMSQGIDKTPDRATREKLVAELRKITEGKVHLR